MLKWICEIPGPVSVLKYYNNSKSIWESGTYKLYMDFSHDYPMKPPKCNL